MNLLTKENDLIHFIQEKKNGDESIDPSKLYYYYSKIIKLAYIKTYLRLENINYSKICADIIENIFWMIFQFTFNIKLTMFLCERAIILFIEYLYLSKDNLNITEAKIFVYEKTIGPININEFKIKKDNSSLINKIKYISNHCENINRFYYHILQHNNSEEYYTTISEYFESILNIFSLFPTIKIIYKVLFELIIELKQPILCKINLLYIVTHIFYIKKKTYDDLTKINKYSNNFNLNEINKIYNKITDIEFSNTYEHFYNCFT